MSCPLSRQLLVLALSGAVACSSSTNAIDAGPVADAGMSQSLYAKYGGAPTVQKIVDDAVAALLADCLEAPYFTNTLDKPGHDSTARLKSCLRLQFTALLGGPATYPGTSDDGDMCESMQMIHSDLGIPGPVFDHFIVDVATALKANGFSDPDIQMVAPALTNMKSQIVSATPVTYDSCDGGLDGGAVDGGTTDGGLGDAGVSDAGTADAGFADAGLTDAGMTDAGTGDAGP